MYSNLLLKIITGEASVREKEDYYKFLTQNKEEEELFFQTQSLWFKTNSQNQLSHEFVVAEYEDFLKRVDAQEQKHIIGRSIQFRKYAAILVTAVLVGGIGGYMSHQLINKPAALADSGVQKFSSAKGSIARLELSDGTMISLNSGSEMIFSQSSTGERKVKLVGEAYFEVKHNALKPFVVEVEDLKIRDLGTIFNLRGYPEDKTIETTLLEGKAEIMNDANKTMMVLAPGDHAEYTKRSKNISLSAMNLELVTGWKDGKFVFRDKRLEDICAELQNWYDVKFEITNPDYRNFKYSGTIKHSTTVAYVLKMLKFTTNINYEICNKPIGPDLIIIK